MANRVDTCSGGKKNQPAKREKLTLATVNDDFTDTKSRLTRLNKVADVMMVQEARGTNVRALMGKESGVHQDRSSEDRAGPAVVWDRKDARATARGFKLASQKGHEVLDRMVSVHRLNRGPSDHSPVVANIVLPR